MLKDVKILDQTNDEGCRFITKVASKLADEDLAGSILDLALKCKPMAKVASFPCDTPEDAILSRVYFDAQRNLFSEKTAAELDEKIGKAQALFDVNNIQLYVKPVLEKKASAKYRMLAGVEFPSLEKAAADFSANYLKLDYPDRIEFSQNFCKYAEAEGADIPADIAVYTAENTELRPDALDQLHFRKLAAERAGRNGSIYDDLAKAVATSTSATPDAMFKLAAMVHSIDDYFGFTEPSYDKRLPDAWHAVLQKRAEIDDSDTQNELSKSDILARFGEGALDEVENPDGSINSLRLRQIQRLFSDAEPEADKPSTSSSN